jgi:hypothetical protein
MSQVIVKYRSVTVVTTVPPSCWKISAARGEKSRSWGKGARAVTLPWRVRPRAGRSYRADISLAAIGTAKDLVEGVQSGLLQRPLDRLSRIGTARLGWPMTASRSIQPYILGRIDGASSGKRFALTCKLFAVLSRNKRRIRTKYPAKLPAEWRVMIVFS